MATKWKSAERDRARGNAFAGVISWLCEMGLILALAAAVPALALLALNAGMTQAAGLALRRFWETLGGDWAQALQAALPPLGLGMLALWAAALTFAFRRDRKAFEADMAWLLGKVWVEVKLALIALAAVALPPALLENAGAVPAPLVLCPALAAVLYFLCLDIGHNRRFFSHNILRSILVGVTNFRGRPGFSRRSLRRAAVTMELEGAMAAAACALLASGFVQGTRFFGPGSLMLLVGAAAGVEAWYIAALKQDLTDQEALSAQIAELYGGNLDAANHIPPASPLYDTAMQLNMIRTGIQRAVDEGVKADRAKVELITNVSHDIKTPLTSIISYVELLRAEPGLSDQAKDYVNTIAQKADRLSHIVQDVFEVSKAATGNLPLELEDLDLGKLLRQTLGEMEGTLDTGRLAWRVSVPEEPVMIRADGQRLYRVFQNLIRNCDQYSLAGSRVYVDLRAEQGQAVATLRNVSRGELPPGDELTGRFVRGDQTRSTEGSGLGLSIAKSFTEACGGGFSVSTQGDLFTATVTFPIAPESGPPDLTENPP